MENTGPEHTGKTYHKQAIPEAENDKYQLCQPIWFEMIMKRLANDKRREEKENSYSELPVHYLN